MRRVAKNKTKSPCKKRVEVRVVRSDISNDARVLVGKLVHKGRQLTTGKEVQIPGLNHMLPIVDHEVFGLRTIAVTVAAPQDDSERLSARKKWNFRDAPTP